MKTDIDSLSKTAKGFIAKILNLAVFSPGPAIASLLLFIVTAAVITNTMINEADGISDFEAGRVAERDIFAGFAFSYIDEDATRIRIEAQERLVPAVFRHSAASTAEILGAWNRFSDFSGGLVERGDSAAAALLAVQAEYPGLFSHSTLNAYFTADDRETFRDYGIEILGRVLSRGVFAIDMEELIHFNPDIVELRHYHDGSRRVISHNDIITVMGINRAIEDAMEEAGLPASFKAVGVMLLRPFITENVFFSPEETGRRILEARENTAPVIRTVEQGQRIIRRGFIITEAEMQELKALHALFPARALGDMARGFLLILFVYALFAFLRSGLILGKKLSSRESYLFSALLCFYIIMPFITGNIFQGNENIPVSLIFPTALPVMIFAVFMGTRTSLIMAIALPLTVYIVGGYDYFSLIIALVSGVAASAVLQGAQKRMEIIKAGLIIAAANAIAVIVIMIIRRAGLDEYPLMFFLAALNGIVSGMLLLGILPPLEQALNAVTPFRLIELSDLNAPILRKLFTTAPGTYSHSIMVATMAEQACQDIGANALLARVGAYYHDIGKMENPDYFVENQTDYNRHDDIAPRLSATVIRSHVKLGAEKAGFLKLPGAVADIIREHHGNSLISWFYNKAAEQEGNVDIESFSYPGNPPRSRESAVVMLADVTEAAVRTLSKPNATKMDKFIQGLFESKMEGGQLAKSELTFRELGIIKNAFVKVLAGYYHSRIEYPNQKEGQAE